MGSRFEGQAVLVAGGTGGLGRAVSLAFLDEGARVTVTWRHREEYDALRQAAALRSDRLEGIEVDVTSVEGAERLVGQVVESHGGLDVLVNVEGGYAGGRKLWELEPETVERMLVLNLRSGFSLARAAVPVMIGRQRGAIVNVAARAALVHPAGGSAYAASKAAAWAMMDSLAAELKGTGVRVNTILPSVIDTDPNRKSMPSADFSKWPKPEEIARVILFLSSDEARVVHGAAIPVYGDS